MDDNNNTVAPIDQTGAEQALPEQPIDTATADVTPVNEPSEPSQDGDEETQPQTAPTVDDKLNKFAKSQGIELDSPSAIKAATIAMKAQSEATRNYQKSQELEKATNISPDQVPADATPQVQDNVRLRNMEMRLEIQTWKTQNPEKLALEPEMIKILQDQPIKKQLVQEGYMSYDDLYKLAKADAPDNSAEVKSQGKREALQSLAQKQQASVPKGHATTATTPKEKPFKELSISEMEQRLGFARR